MIIDQITVAVTTFTAVSLLFLYQCCNVGRLVSYIGEILPNLGQRYIAALSQLSQFHFVIGDKTRLTHILSGVQVAPESDDEDAEDADLLRLTFGGGHTVLVIAAHYLELMLSEDAAHQMHSASEGSGEIHKRAERLLEHLSRKHNLQD